MFFAYSRVLNDSEDILVFSLADNLSKGSRAFDGIDGRIPGIKHIFE